MMSFKYEMLTKQRSLGYETVDVTWNLIKVMIGKKLWALEKYVRTLKWQNKHQQQNSKNLSCQMVLLPNQFKCITLTIKFPNISTRIFKHNSWKTLTGCVSSGCFRRRSPKISSQYFDILYCWYLLEKKYYC